VSYDLQAAQVTPPGTGTKTSITGTSTAAINLSAFEGKWVTLIASVKTHIRWGKADVTAATTDDVYIPADTERHYFIPKSGTRSYFRAIRASADGDLHHAGASDGE
jgi:hypothetical protein